MCETLHKKIIFLVENDLVHQNLMAVLLCFFPDLSPVLAAVPPAAPLRARRHRCLHDLRRARCRRRKHAGHLHLHQVRLTCCFCGVIFVDG